MVESGLDDERALFSMEPSMRVVMAGKKLASLKSVLTDMQYADSTLCVDLLAGFDLVGLPQ